MQTCASLPLSEGKGEVEGSCMRHACSSSTIICGTPPMAPAEVTSSTPSPVELPIWLPKEDAMLPEIIGGQARIRE